MRCNARNGKNIATVLVTREVPLECVGMQYFTSVLATVIMQCLAEPTVVGCVAYIANGG